MIRTFPPDVSADGDGGLALAIEAAGGHRQLAAILGLTRQAIKQSKRLDPERLLTIERATGLERHEMRPDLYQGYVRISPVSVSR